MLDMWLFILETLVCYFWNLIGESADSDLLHTI